MQSAIHCPYFQKAFGWSVPIGGLASLVGLGGGEFRLPVLMYWGCARRGGDGETNAAFAENLHEYSTEGRTWRFAENLHVYLKAISLISFYQYLLPSLST
jgi:hypothetical protein